MPGRRKPLRKAFDERRDAPSGEPSALVPGLPTIAAAVPGYEIGASTGIFAPARTPTTVIRRLNQEMVRFLKTPEAKEKYQ